MVSDVSGANDSENAKRFIEQVVIDGRNTLADEKRTAALLQLGRAGMALWKELFENADSELKAILKESNFNPCCENDGACRSQLYNGYRIDLIYDIPNAKEHAESMMQRYATLGYKMCQMLSPDEVVARDKSLAQFCSMHSVGELGQRQWRNDSVALWRPGGCLDTQKFLPKLVDYLTKNMANRFKLKFKKQVTGVIVDNPEAERVMIKGLKFADGTETKEKASYDGVSYDFCPGEAVGTLRELGFSQPADAGFAGASLSLNIPVSEEKLKEFDGLNHYMEVHKVGVVLAWQARIRDGMIFLGGAGTKAFYGDVVPKINDDFARTNNLLQLRMFNDVLPQVVSIALRRDTTGQLLSEEDMETLEENAIAKRWVGRRAVAFDGFPTLGRLYYSGKLVSNAQTTTHLGSGGGSFSLIMSLISDYAVNPEIYMEQLDRLNLSHEFVQEVLGFADSQRDAK